MALLKGQVTGGASLPILLASQVSGILPPNNGGTGIANNVASTITISGAFATTFTVTGVTSVTLPTTGSLATIDTAQTISGAKTFLDQTVKLRNPANTFSYNIVHGAIVANRDLNIPVLTATDTFAVLGLGQTYTGANTFSGLNAILVSSSGLTVRNPANTFKYTITAAAIAADRILNLPLITATDTLASLGLAQTFSQNQTFGGDIIKSGSIFVVGGNGASCNRLTTGLYTTNSPSYKLTNAGGAVAPYFLGTSSASTAGVLSYIMDGTNGLMLGHGNGTTQIAGAAFKLTNLDNTAGSEDSDLSVYTQAAGATLAERFVFTNNGRIYAKGIHNNAGAVTGATNQYIASGTYTPTLTNTTNISASTPRLCSWIRVGNVVTVGGQLDIDPTALGDTLLGISLPIASALTTAYQLGGSGSSTAIVNESYGIEADAANDRASMKNKAVDLTNHTVAFTFTYEVL